MQNRYVGDSGDFLKLGILRALSPGCRLGVAWWLFPDEGHNQDGRHVGYHNRPDRWRHLDCDLFDTLGQIMSAGQRHVKALEAANLLPGAIFANEVIPTNEPVSRRRQARQEWFQTVVATLQKADLVFVDSDNGLEPTGFRHGSGKAGMSITLNELRALARPGRRLIVYHHHTRRAGGHHAEIKFWPGRLREAGFGRVDALRARPYSPRVFSLLDARLTFATGPQRSSIDGEDGSHGILTVQWERDGERGQADKQPAPVPRPLATVRPHRLYPTHVGRCPTSPERTGPIFSGRHPSCGTIDTVQKEMVESLCETIQSSRCEPLYRI